MTEQAFRPYTIAVTTSERAASIVERIAREDFTVVKREVRLQADGALAIAIVVDTDEFERWVAR